MQLQRLAEIHFSQAWEEIDSSGQKVKRGDAAKEPTRRHLLSISTQK